MGWTNSSCYEYDDDVVEYEYDVDDEYEYEYDVDDDDDENYDERAETFDDDKANKSYNITHS
jgi:hypothetical protein